MKLSRTPYLLLSSIAVTSALMFSGCSAPLNKTPITHDHSTPVAANTQAHKSPDLTNDNIQNAIPKVVYYPNIWDEMSKSFDLAHLHYGRYDKHLSFYNKRQRHLEKVSQRAKPYLYYIFNEVKKRNMPYEIALLPIVESGFRSHARSHQRAVGLWQFIPSTADIFDLDRNWWYDGRKDLIKSTQAALDYLEKLHRQNNNDWLLALASYNAGLGNVYRAQKKYRKKHKHRPGIKDYKPNYWEITPYLPKETQGYVPKLLAVSHIIEYAGLFDVDIEPIENKPYFTTVNIDKQIALNQVASSSNTKSDIVKLLNPAYQRFATPPKGPHHILLPIEKAPQLITAINADKDLFTIRWKRHKIRSGDSLSVIAQRYKTSSRAIKKMNGMKSSRIRAGKTLLIPIPADPLNKNSLANSTQLAKAKTTNKTVKHRAKASPKSKPNTKANIYTVKAGDSLWQIAKQHQVRIKQLLAWNNLSSKTSLRVGQKLTIHGANLAQSGLKIEHTLKRGENLWILSKKYKVSTQKIAHWNNIAENKLLKPGMKLVIWTQTSASLEAVINEYIVKRGDNLWNIAKANKISAKQLAKHNKLTLKTPLQPGQVLRIPKES